MNKKTGGELLFERYMASQGMVFEYEPELDGTTKKVDYVFHHATEGKILFEVKDIENGFPVGSFSQIDVYKPIRKHISKATEKFRDMPDASCVLVLVAGVRGFVQLMEPHAMLGAMYGNIVFRVPFDPYGSGLVDSEPYMDFEMGTGKMIHKTGPQNKRISALISLSDYYTHAKEGSLYLKTDDGRTQDERWSDLVDGKAGISEERTPCVTVWENAVATKKLPRDLFHGDMDAWWTVDEGGQSLSFIGERRQRLNIDRVR